MGVGRNSRAESTGIECLLGAEGVRITIHAAGRGASVRQITHRVGAAHTIVRNEADQVAAHRRSARPDSLYRTAQAVHIGDRSVVTTAVGIEVTALGHRARYCSGHRVGGLDVGNGTRKLLAGIQRIGISKDESTLQRSAGIVGRESDVDPRTCGLSLSSGGKVRNPFVSQRVSRIQIQFGTDHILSPRRRYGEGTGRQAQHIRRRLLQIVEIGLYRMLIGTVGVCDRRTSVQGTSSPVG